MGAALFVYEDVGQDVLGGDGLPARAASSDRGCRAARLAVTPDPAYVRIEAHGVGGELIRHRGLDARQIIRETPQAAFDHLPMHCVRIARRCAPVHCVLLEHHQNPTDGTRSLRGCVSAAKTAYTSMLATMPVQYSSSMAASVIRW